MVSTSIRSAGPQSKAVQIAARVESLSWRGWLLNSADTEAGESSTPARSDMSRRSAAAVQTSRWAAAIRRRHLMSVSTPF